MIVNTNIPLMETLKNSGRTGLNITRASERFGSGLKINRGADDPSGLAIASVANAQIRGINTAMHNVQESMHIYNLRDAYMENISDILVNMRDLAVRAANEATMTPGDLDAIQKEMEGLREQIDQMAKTSIPTASGPTRLLYAPAKLDVVWILDHSYSMEPFVTNLANAAEAMFKGFFEKGFDLSMGAISFGHNDITSVFDETQAMLGAPQNSTSASPSSGAMHTAVDDFRADVQAISSLAATPNGLGIEQGLDAVSETLNLAGGLGPSLRADASKVFVLVTNEGSDDNGEEGIDLGWGGGNSPTQAQIDATINALNAADIDLDVAGSWGWQLADSSTFQNSPDADPVYQQVAAATGGISVPLDTEGQWVNPIIASLQNRVADWQASFQVGPDNDSAQRIETTFMSVTSSTLGVEGFDVRTAAGAQAAISAVDGAIATLNNEREHTAAAVQRMEYILNDLAAQNIGISGYKSDMEDADFGDEALALTISKMLENTAISAQTQANANPKAAASEYIQAVNNAEQVNIAGIFTVGKQL